MSVPFGLESDIVMSVHGDG